MSQSNQKNFFLTLLWNIQSLTTWSAWSSSSVFPRYYKYAMYNIHVLHTLLWYLQVNFTGCQLKDLYSKCSLISKGRELVVKRHKAFQSKTMLDFSEDHKFKLNAEHVNDFSLKIQIKRSAPPLQKSEFSIGITQLRFERHSSVHILSSPVPKPLVPKPQPSPNKTQFVKRGLGLTLKS